MDYGALAACAVRRQNWQFAKRNEISPPGIFRLMAAFVGQRVKRE